MTPTLTIVSTLGIVLFSGLVIFLIALGRTLAISDDISDRIQTYAVLTDERGPAAGGKRRIRFLRLRLRINTALSALVPAGLRTQLISANWPIFETEYIIIRLGLTVVAFFLAWVLGQSIYPGIGAALIAYLLPGIFMRKSINQRRRQFERQLIDVLILINGGVGAGYSLLQALDIVIDEMPSPSAEEFNRVRREVGLGLPLSQALENLARRMENDDLNIMVAAININMQVGGNLTVMLRVVTETIRERIRLFSEVRSITSAQRFTGYVLTFLPFIMGGAMFIMNPEYMKRLFEPGWVLCIPIGAVLGIIMGNLVIRKMVHIDV
ncbi:MAG: type II secretion system F family protein [Anaerolineales bacterium]|nr:type II secretion system F family protein [Anaerolineales bacterium]